MKYSKQDLIDVLYEITDGRWFTTEKLYLAPNSYADTIPTFHESQEIIRIIHINTKTRYPYPPYDGKYFNTHDVNVKDTLLRLEDMGFIMKYYTNVNSGQLIPSKYKPMWVTYIDILI